MHLIQSFTLGIGLAVLLPVSLQAQRTPQSVQVVVGADGSIKVIDPKTGKEVPSVVTRTQTPISKEQADMVRTYLERLQQGPEGSSKKAQIEIELELQKRDKALQEKKTAGKKGEFQEIEVEIQKGPDGEFRVVRVQPGKGSAKPMSLEQKVDRLLDEMASLRKDVNQLKDRMAGARSELPYQMYWQPYLPKGWDKKPMGGKKEEFRIELDLRNVENLKELAEALKKFEMKQKDGKPSDQWFDMLKKYIELEKGEKKQPEKKQPAVKDAERTRDLERRLERLLDEAEAIRRELQKSKGSKKKKDDE